MEAKEKAKELMGKLLYSCGGSNYIKVFNNAKGCALIAVNQILDSRPVITDSQIEYNNYWNEVKNEINKL